jgi:hypothetical protein
VSDGKKAWAEEIEEREYWRNCAKEAEVLRAEVQRLRAEGDTLRTEVSTLRVAAEARIPLSVRLAYAARGAWHGARRAWFTVGRSGK